MVLVLFHFAVLPLPNFWLNFLWLMFSNFSTDLQQQCIKREEDKYSRLKYFVFFIGYPRSGSTLTGSLLDAHPNVIIANEYDLTRKFHLASNQHITRRYLFDQLLNNSVNEATCEQRSPGYKGLFNYHVPNQWQGKFQCFIQVSFGYSCFF